MGSSLYDHVIPIDDDFNTVPHESILLKLEETPSAWMRDSSLRDGAAAYDEAARRELANWTGEVPWTEGDETWDTKSNSKMMLNLLHHGSRSEFEPRHSEMFLADTEFEDGEIATWNIPKHTAMRARDATRVMPDDVVVEPGDRSVTDVGLLNAKRKTNSMFMNNFKNFSAQSRSGPVNNNTMMKQVRNDFSNRDESLRTFQTKLRPNTNYSGKGPEVPTLVHKQKQEARAGLWVNGCPRSRRNRMSDRSKNARAGVFDSATPNPQLVTAKPKKALTPKDVSSIYREVIGMQSHHAGTTNASRGASGKLGDTIRAGAAGVEGARRVGVGAEGQNRTGAGPQYTAGVNPGVDASVVVIGPDGKRTNGKGAPLHDKTSLLAMQEETTVRMTTRDAHRVAKGLRGGYDPGKLARTTNNAGPGNAGISLSTSDKLRIAKSVGIVARQNVGKNARRVDASAGVVEGRGYIASTGADVRRLRGPKSMVHGSERNAVQYNQQKTLATQNRLKKSSKMAQPIARTLNTRKAADVTVIEGEQKLMSMQKKMGTKRLRPTEISIRLDNNGLANDWDEDDDDNNNELWPFQ